MHALVAQLGKLYAELRRPSPEELPRGTPARFKEILDRDPSTLSMDELDEIAWCIGPGLVDNLDLLRYYLPFLLDKYMAGTWSGEELECRLLQYREHLSEIEIDLLTEILMQRWKQMVSGMYHSETAFLMFWLPDPAPLEEGLVHLEERLAVATCDQERAIHRLQDLRDDVRQSVDPVRCLWDQLYLMWNTDGLDRVRLRSEQGILRLLTRIGWIDSSSHAG